jgi:hypothetical protein
MLLFTPAVARRQGLSNGLGLDRSKADTCLCDVGHVLARRRDRPSVKFQTRDIRGTGTGTAPTLVVDGVVMLRREDGCVMDGVVGLCQPNLAQGTALIDRARLGVLYWYRTNV